MKRTTGFTLIELLVVILVMSAVVGGTMLSLDTRDPSKLVRPEAVRMQAYFQEAQYYAVNTGQDLGLFFIENSYFWKIIAEEEDEATGELGFVFNDGEGSIFNPVKYEDDFSFQLLIDSAEVFLEEEINERSVPLVYMQNNGESFPPFEFLIGFPSQFYWQVSSDGYHPPEIIPYAQEF